MGRGVWVRAGPGDNLGYGYPAPVGCSSGAQTSTLTPFLPMLQFQVADNLSGGERAVLGGMRGSGGSPVWSGVRQLSQGSF